MSTFLSAATPDEGSLRFLRDRDLGLILRVTFRLIQDQFREISAAVGMIAGPAYLMVAALGAFADQTDPAQQLVVGFAGVLPSLLLTAAIVAYVRLYRSGFEGQITVSQVWDESKPLILPTLGYQMLVAATFVLGALLVIGVGSLGGTAGIVIGGGIILLVMLAGMPPYLVGLIVRLVDDESTLESFSRGIELVRSRAGLAYGTTAVIFLLTMFVVMTISGAAGAVLAVSSDVANPSPLVLGLTSALTYLFLMVASTIYTIGTAFLHGSLVESLEGTALMDEIAELQSGPESEPAVNELRIRDEPTPPDAGEAPTAGPGNPSPATVDDAPRGGFRGGGFDGPPS